MKILIIKIGSIFLEMIYFFIKLLPTKNKIVFISRQSNSIPYEFKMIDTEIKKIDHNIQTVFLCKTLSKSSDNKMVSISDALSYIPHILKQMYHLATSKVVLLDSYCIPASLLHHKRSLKIVQMWHSMGTMKLFGWTAINKKEGSSYRLAKAMKMHNNYDYFIASSKNYINDLAMGFNCSPDKAIISPLPRYDLLKDDSFIAKTNEKILNRYPFLKNKKIIVYCPTFRKEESTMKKAISDLAETITDDYILVIKLHPLSKITFNGKNTLVDKTFSSMEMITVADYVISDYSCIIYEAALLGKPLYFYTFDFDIYNNARGFAIDYKNVLPGIISDSASFLMSNIEKDNYDVKKINDFAHEYITDVKSASNRIATLLIKLLH